MIDIIQLTIYKSHVLILINGKYIKCVDLMELTTGKSIQCVRWIRHLYQMEKLIHSISNPQGPKNQYDGYGVGPYQGLDEIGSPISIIIFIIISSLFSHTF